MAATLERCIFCSRPRTNKLGEHVWDAWLNRENGKTIFDPGHTYHYGINGALIRDHPSHGLHVTLPVVCDHCNNNWMSDLSNAAKPLLEPSIRRNVPRDYDIGDIWTLTAFMFLKAAVLDWAAKSSIRQPCISRAACVAFRESLMSPELPERGIALPDGLQLWIARFRRTQKMEARTSTDELTGVRQFKGYKILVVTYQVGSFIFQMTFPRWTRRTRNHPDPPFFDIHGDLASVRIWPGVDVSYWPPPAQVSGKTFDAFRQRFRRVLIRTDEP